jgi:nicotinamidase-related amidase
VSGRGATTVVLALHYQNDVLHADGKIRVGLAGDSQRRAQLIDSAVALLAGARARDWPIVHVRVAFQPDGSDIVQNAPIFRAVAASGAVRDGSWGADFHEALLPDVSNAAEHAVTHTRINAFYGTTLDLLLNRLGATRLVIAGVATHSVVESTVRHAADMGFDVWVAADACAAADPAVHQAALASMQLIATVGTVAECLHV